MTGWLFVASLAVLILALGRLADRSERQQRALRRQFLCPRSREPVECVLVADARTGEWVGVRSCSAFPDPEDIRCEGNCVKLLNLGFTLGGEEMGGQESPALPAGGRL